MKNLFTLIVLISIVSGCGKSGFVSPYSNSDDEMNYDDADNSSSPEIRRTKFNGISRGVVGASSYQYGYSPLQNLFLAIADKERSMNPDTAAVSILRFGTPPGVSLSANTRYCFYYSIQAPAGYALRLLSPRHFVSVETDQKIIAKDELSFVSSVNRRGIAVSLARKNVACASMPTGWDPYQQGYNGNYNNSYYYYPPQTCSPAYQQIPAVTASVAVTDCNTPASAPGNISVDLAPIFNQTSFSASVKLGEAFPAVHPPVPASQVGFYAWNVVFDRMNWMTNTQSQWQY